MGLLGKLIGDGAGGLIGGVADAVDRFVQSPDEKTAAALKERALDMQAQMRALDIAEVEAKHPSVFVAGARPATLWVCTACMAGIVVAAVWGFFSGTDVTPLYAVYGSTVAPTHLTLIGARTYEKAKGIHKEHLK